MYYTTVFVAILGTVVVFAIRRAVSPIRLPPGVQFPPTPKGKPIIGNLLDIPSKHSWRQFFSWAKQLGPLYKLNLMGREHVIVSTEKIANDLLRERGNIYSGREQFPMATKLVSRNLRILLLPHADLWRRERKFIHQMTMAAAAVKYEAVQIEESLRVLKDLIRAPAQYETWYERFSAGLILRIGFGKMVWTGEEDFVRRIIHIVHGIERVLSPGAYLVDTFPILLWLPKCIAPFKREGDRMHREEISLFRGLLEEAKTDLKAGKAPNDTFAAKFLEKQEEYRLSFDDGAYILGSLYEAGAGTTSAAMMSFTLAMTLYPECLLKLQKEVDMVCGDRLPTFRDMENLPTVRATVKETLRWRPVTAGGMPHILEKDDVYTIPNSGEKIFLAANSTIHANQWAIHREEALYPNAERFLPDRWLNPKYPTYKGPLSVYPNIQNFSAFGFGRRICAGQNIAERSLNLLVARIGWACDISRPKDATGKFIEIPEYDYTSGLNAQPNFFPFELTARLGRERTINDEWQTVWGDRVQA